MNPRPLFVLFGLLAGAWVRGGEDALFAGGPLFVGRPTEGADGQPILWDVTQPVPYRVDGGPLGTMTNALAASRVQSLFQVWENVPTAAVRFTNQGAIQSVGSFTDGDVCTAPEFCEITNDSNDIIDGLPESQAGKGRHKCAVCAYHEGFNTARAQAMGKTVGDEVARTVSDTLFK